MQLPVLPRVSLLRCYVDSVLVKSKGMFKEYWNKPEATAAAFDDEVRVSSMEESMTACLAQCCTKSSKGRAGREVR